MNDAGGSLAHDARNFLCAACIGTSNNDANNNHGNHAIDGNHGGWAGIARVPRSDGAE